jgi:hypothetical protein
MVLPRRKLTSGSVIVSSLSPTLMAGSDESRPHRTRTGVAGQRGLPQSSRLS